MSRHKCSSTGSFHFTASWTVLPGKLGSFWATWEPKWRCMFLSRDWELALFLWLTLPLVCWRCCLHALSPELSAGYPAISASHPVHGHAPSCEQVGLNSLSDHCPSFSLFFVSLILFDLFLPLSFWPLLSEMAHLLSNDPGLDSNISLGIHKAAKNPSLQFFSHFLFFSFSMSIYCTFL